MSYSIWVITAEFEPDIIGGLGIVATNLVGNWAASQEVQVTVITLSSTALELELDERGKGLSIYRVPRKEPYFTKGDMQNSIVKEVLDKSLKPDIIHVHSIQGVWLGRSISASFRIPLVYTSHSIVSKDVQIEHPNYLRYKRNDYFKKAINRQEVLYQSADAIIFPSEQERKVFSKIYPEYTHKITVIPNGFSPRPYLQTERDQNRILFVGRLSEIKGITHLIRALPHILKENQNAYLKLIGSTDRSNYTKEVKEEINKLGLEKVIQIHPWKSHSEILQEYSEAGVVVVPSLYESFGLVPLEALSQGTPVVLSTHVGSIDYLPKEMITVVSSLDPRNLGAALHAQMNQSIQIQERSWLKDLSWSEVAGQYLRFFQALSNR